jgi:hypothetical protein
MEKRETPKSQIYQSVVPFFSGAEKAQNYYSISPGPGSYLLADPIIKENNPTRAVFNSKQRRIAPLNSSTTLSPGPGSYNTDIQWLKPNFIPPMRRKILYKSTPSIPINSPVNSEVIIEENHCDKSISKGISFAKAPRKFWIQDSPNMLGPGEYDPISLGANKGSTFGKSRKNPMTNKPACDKSYYKEEYFSGFRKVNVPRILQNFGNRCERVTVDIKNTIGPGHYDLEIKNKRQYISAAFNSSELRFRTK